MSPPLRRSLVGLSIALTLTFLVWGGSVVYWHLRLRTAVQRLGSLARPESAENEDAVILLYESGCRSLPYLVASLDESQSLSSLRVRTFAVAWISVVPGMTPSEFGDELLHHRLRSWLVEPEDSPAAVRQKLRLIREWWAAEGSEHHQLWRTWTNACRPFRPDEGGRR